MRILIGSKELLYSFELVGDYPQNYKPKITTYGTVDDTNLCEVLNIKVGARVMVIMNVDTMDSLANGSLGVILDVVTNNDGKMKYVVIKFDLQKSGLEQRQKNPQIANRYNEENETLIFWWKISTT